MGNALSWAIRQGLANPDEVRAETLRQLCRLTVWQLIESILLAAILITLLVK